MAKRPIKNIDPLNPPQSLDETLFFGMTLDDEQKKFRDAIWSEDKLVILCDAKAGSGKTQIAVMVAELLYRYHRYDGIVYITAPVQEQKIGFLPGTAQEKLSVYNEPFYQAALKANINIEQSLCGNVDSEKNSTAYLGRVVSVQYFEETNDSAGNPSLRFPIFKELREPGKEVSYT